MQIINVIPISKSINKETLTYFSASPLKEGSIVFVPLRKKEAPAIVLSSRNITDMKTKIKRASFALKKIDNKKTYALLLPEFVAAARDVSEYFATTTGAVLTAMVPSAVMDEIEKVDSRKEKSSIAVKGFSSCQKLILQSEITDRFTSYKSLVREKFAQDSSVFLLVPTMQEAERAQKFLKKGIESHTYVLHGNLTKKEIIVRWKNALKSKHPVLIIATGMFLSIPREDIRTIIVERENSRAYKKFNRPFIDIRVFAEFFAEHKKAQIIFGDLPLKVETMWKYQENELDEFSTPKLRTISGAMQTLVDMKNIKHQKAGHFEIISEELKKLIADTIDVPPPPAGGEGGGNVFVFTVRRGLSASTICRDCGNAVLCHECKAPITLYATSKGNRFICGACGASRSANERCKNCASWKLETVGIGIQLVEKKLREEFPKAQIFVIDKDTASTHKQAKTLVEKFYSTKGSILLGTEMALFYLDKPVKYSAVVSMDSLFALPQWRMSEKILSLLLKIKEITEKELLIQTRKPNQKVFEYAAKGNLVDFYKDEIKKRKQFGYPPFSIFIKITIVGSEKRVCKKMKYAEKLFKKYDIKVYPPLIKTARGKFAMHGLLKIEKDKWFTKNGETQKELLETLRSLPPHFSIDVDPESLL